MRTRIYAASIFSLAADDAEQPGDLDRVAPCPRGPDFSQGYVFDGPDIIDPGRLSSSYAICRSPAPPSPSPPLMQRVAYKQPSCARSWGDAALFGWLHAAPALQRRCASVVADAGVSFL